MHDDGDEGGLLAAAARYERALREDDLDALDALFAPGPRTVRAEGGTALVGHDQISAFRRGRGGAPTRWLRRVHLRAVSADDAFTVSETERLDGGRGLQTQFWHRGPDGWRITAAHVSSAPPAGPTRQPAGASAAPADATTWRTPDSATALPAGAGTGPLAGIRVAVKDLVAVAGQRTGGGVPRWLEQARTEPVNAPALQALLDAGAGIAGIAQTDELAFSLLGVNAHHGVPPNPAAPGRVPGGSSSGCAAAVASGTADLGLGTDTAGSLRVPGSFSGLYAWRPTHGAVDATGVLPLAPTFDTVGLLARDAGVLAVAAAALLTGPTHQPARPRALLRSRTLFQVAEPTTALAVEAALRALAVQTGLPLRDVDDVGADFTGEEVTAWTTAFRTVQAAEAWASHGAFITAHPGALSPAVEARFRAGEGVGAETLSAARTTIEATRACLTAVLRGGWLCLPSTATPAPRIEATPDRFEAVRAGTLPLTTLASQTGVPALNLPWGRVGDLPVGLCVLAPHGQDRSLLALLSEVAPHPRTAARLP
ncbi:Asp-tRNA(Asn)/Glu-tRNA(Gln) amidotransferase A subunit family amidase [Kineococcus radiotolerans]|uniref:Asp-tRNA(Asn)/Glu-tRNA(Gln) amidotransferase A subunit family amidase n=1 Tax=Kineococcus radiotolerans TaxID=131568 RepID=A0A7W4TI58_KINRA|nr:AtzH-like domain-containing protein [Kineococcus radiotolerans]MBB2899315.1 Asp-tRNA(Asn)/Glu-tRNA(Gln) amidotransferase A subunit family amidase [Kineococcus radiotolerans]